MEKVLIQDPDPFIDWDRLPHVPGACTLGDLVPRGLQCASFDTASRVFAAPLVMFRTSGDMIFNDNLSGIQLLFDLPISKSLNNECC